LVTVHTLHPKVMAIIPHVKKLFVSAAMLCTEIKLDMFTVFTVGRAMVLSGNQTLDQMLDKNLYKRVVEIAGKYGLNEARVNKLKPWAVVMMYSIPPKQNDGGLDIQLFKEAVQQKKQVCGLEQVEEQLEVFRKWTIPQQIEMLRVVVNNYQTMNVQFEQLVDNYSRRDLAGMVVLVKQSPKPGKIIDVNDFTHRLIVRRNIIMANRMQPYLKKGNALIAVGALHLPGEKGLLQLLEGMGYKVTRIY